MQIDQNSVENFKLSYCDENRIIAELLKSHFSEWVAEPIVDVGCGLGDISSFAFAKQDVILIDRLRFPRNFDRKEHRRMTADFFDWKSERQSGTLLFCHVLQFLDERIDRLFSKVSELQPRKIITVTNTNRGLLNDLLTWGMGALRDANPEVPITGFPPGYSPELTETFTAQVQAPDFSVLAEQVLYLFDVSAGAESKWELERFLKGKLVIPHIEIEQEIIGYTL